MLLSSIDDIMVMSSIEDKLRMSGNGGKVCSAEARSALEPTQAEPTLSQDLRRVI